jgi:hypothetical protein
MPRKIRRTSYRSKSGRKLYSVRDRSGKFIDVQTYRRAHSGDLRRKSRRENAGATAT